jgi:fumarylacetoacetase
VDVGGTGAGLVDVTESRLPEVRDGDPFGLHNLPYGAAVISERAVLTVRIGDLALDLAAACTALRPDLAEFVSGPVLNPLLSAGPETWRELRASVRSWLCDDAARPTIEPLLHPLDGLTLALPFEVADYVDFYASEHHAANVGRIFRPAEAPLPENWTHLPVGYHGRAGTVVVSGTDIIRPRGQRRAPSGPVFGPSTALDFEAEVGFVLGNPTPLGRAVPLSEAADHIFGVCLVNDWSARDIQHWETRPLGPFLGKSFATSVSPWIVPLDALDSARVPPASRGRPLLPYLDESALAPQGLDVELTVSLNGHVIARLPYRAMYWSPAQMLAHLTVNGASIRAGDLFASGTVSGPGDDQLGCLLEATRTGTNPLTLPDGSTRSFLQDGDEVVIRGRVPATAGRPELGLGEVTGRVLPTR